MNKQCISLLLGALVVLTFFGVLVSRADAPVQWEKAYGGDKYDYGGRVQQTSDGGYIVVATTSSSTIPRYHGGDSDIYLIKTGADGTVQWEKAYGGAGWDGFMSVQQTNDGGYVAAGWTYSSTIPGYHGEDDVYVIKLGPEQ